jgi:hypothetical protein
MASIVGDEGREEDDQLNMGFPVVHARQLPVSAPVRLGLVSEMKRCVKLIS